MSSLPPLTDPDPNTPAITPSPAVPTLMFGGYAGIPGEIQGETFLRRAIARIIDTVAHFIISLIAGVIFGIVLGIVLAVTKQPSTPEFYARFQATTVSSFLLAILGWTFFEAIQEAVHGSTIGKLCLGMVVVQEDGSPCRFGAAIIRSFAYLIDSLFFGLIGYMSMKKSPKEQRHGDEWAHTIVCARKEARNPRGAGRFIAGFLVGAMADSALIIAGLLLKMF